MSDGKTVEISDEEIKEFIGGLPRRNVPDEEEKEINIPRDPVFDGDGTTPPPDPSKNPFIDPKLLELTDIDIRLFVKSLLHDEPLVLPVTIDAAGTEIPFRIRSRSRFEFHTVVSLVDQETKNGEHPDTQSAMNRLRDYFASIQVVEVGGKQFADKELTPGMSMDEAYQILRDERVRLVDGMSVVRAELFWKAMTIADIKSNLLLTKSASPKDFTKPLK